MIFSRHRRHFFGLVMALALSAAAKTAAPDTAYAILQNILTPTQLVAGAMPRAYCAAVTLEGPLAREMAEACVALGLPPPEYEELFDKGNFSLRLANATYPAQTRDLLSGVLNPVAMIDMLLTGLIKYRENARFTLLTRETVIQKSQAVIQGRTITTVHLRPRAQRFGYSCEDRGGQLYETWLTALDCSIDMAARLAVQIKLRKQTRLHGPQSDTPRTTSYCYSFEYQEIDKRQMPVAMTISINDSQTLAVRAHYRREKNALVFDTKEIVCRNTQDSAATGIRLVYGAYQFNPAAKTVRHGDIVSAKYGARMIHASRLARLAGKALNEGRLEAALEILRQLSQEYQGTPQALEAQRLLQGLAP